MCYTPFYGRRLLPEKKNKKKKDDNRAISLIEQRQFRKQQAARYYKITLKLKLFAVCAIMNRVNEAVAFESCNVVKSRLASQSFSIGSITATRMACITVVR